MTPVESNYFRLEVYSNQPLDFPFEQLARPTFFGGCSLNLSMLWLPAGFP